MFCSVLVLCECGSQTTFLIFSCAKFALFNLHRSKPCLTVSLPPFWSWNVTIRFVPRSIWSCLFFWGAAGGGWCVLEFLVFKRTRDWLIRHDESRIHGGYVQRRSGLLQKCQSVLYLKSRPACLCVDPDLLQLYLRYLWGVLKNALLVQMAAWCNHHDYGPGQTRGRQKQGLNRRIIWWVEPCSILHSLLRDWLFCSNVLWLFLFLAGV